MMFNFDEKTLTGCVGLFAVVLVITVFMFIFKGKPRICNREPEVEKLQEICKRATQELEYNDVAITSSPYGILGKKKKQLWIEHKVHVKIGIDETKLEVFEENGKWIIQVPQAEVLDAFCDPDSFTEDSFTIQKSFFHKVSAKEQNDAMANAIEELQKDAANQSECLRDAQKRAAMLLDKELSYLKEQTGVTYDYEIRLE